MILKTTTLLLLLSLNIASDIAVALAPSAAASSRSAESPLQHPANDTPVDLPEFNNAEEYLEFMNSVASLPKGFATGAAGGTFISKEAPNLGKLPIRGTVIQLTKGPTDSWAACFTSNMFPGAPVVVGRKRLANGGPLGAIVINNKVSNVCSSADGELDAELVCESVAKALNLETSEQVLPSSTGVIGWSLPAKELAEDIVPEAVQNLQTNSALNAAKAIMTTDRFPKIRSKTLSNGARIVGIAKGAGMIEPNMATMLSYIMTDATISKQDLQKMLSSTVNQTFNCLSVDGDESTSDTVVAVASNQVSEPVDMEEFEQAFYEVCQGLSKDIVRNGEGTSHVMKVDIANFPGSARSARFFGRHIVNSPLFKCAVAGNDPNIGRLARAVGDYLGKYEPDTNVSSLSLTIGNRVIFKNKQFVAAGEATELELSKHFSEAEFEGFTDYPPHQRFVEIVVDFGKKGGDTSVVVLGSDLTKEYIDINADYRS
ncbi:MAG: hypothetical protein SGBAC_011111 [Bacillariaceae sp.]